ncbi:uncharacterized protein LY89DRAFT_183063 [Mollisia scopiformis]|uniref:Zn(2)-C6 fungal-type domain-containing protein n=1 Tax=Mollisia scopiformis TaxID=149040 RepID=A0A194XUS4_MOLSC|nr:uncharacterized protein LY89DRAFT_183063 [Mollisia scopiformis]KUJ23457.1 hypothetical protein LY89DRAFT_183063 [Mollisia scopiformis]
MDGRSHTGCWTCRARRKRCDESRQTCATCNSLGLPCHGYGPRPAWMDGGPIQRARAVEFREIVKRRPRQRWLSFCTSEAIQSPIDDRLSSDSSSAVNQSTRPNQRTNNARQDILPNLSTPEKSIVFPSSGTSTFSNAVPAIDFPNVFEAGLDSLTPLDTFDLSHACPQRSSVRLTDSLLASIFDSSPYLEGLDNVAPDDTTSMLDLYSHRAPSLATPSREAENDIWSNSKPLGTNIAMSTARD